MSERQLDQIVKGAPRADANKISVPTTGVISSSKQANAPPMKPGDPLASLPSSPPQIYLNLLILEASLRAQYLELRARRRQHTFFLTLLGLWIVYFAYALFLAPREDGSGVGGSVYWVVEMTEKVCFMGGIVTGILIWGTGQWERGIRWPRRWVGTTNRGLRVFNCKLVVMKGPWYKEVLSTLAFLFSNGLFSSSAASSYRYINHRIMADTATPKSGRVQGLPHINEEGSLGRDEDLAAGGDYVKLLLLAKPFSPEFRENWEVYRSEYWEKENERRAGLRVKVKRYDRHLAKQQCGWFWWLGWHGWRRVKGQKANGDVEKTHHRLSSSLEKDPRRLRAGSIRSGSHSRNSSRSSSVTAEPDDYPNEQLTRRASNASTASERRRKKGTMAPGAKGYKERPGSSMGEPTSSPLARENSFTSVSSLDSERLITPVDGDSVKSANVSAQSGGSSLRQAASVNVSQDSTLT